MDDIYRQTVKLTKARQQLRHDQGSNCYLVMRNLAFNIQTSSCNPPILIYGSVLSQSARFGDESSSRQQNDRICI